MSDEQLQQAKGGEGPAEMETVVVDLEEEAQKEKEIHEASLVNRALCNLEMSTASLDHSVYAIARLTTVTDLHAENYGSCNRDCAAAIKMNSRNVKTWYRSATACLALDRIAEAEDACRRGLLVDAQNGALRTLSEKISKRKQLVEETERKRREREERKQREAATLKLALKSRNIPTRTTAKAPDMEDAEMRLENPLDPASTLSVPVMLLYPVHMQTDLIKQFQESESVGQHLTYIMPLPWDVKQEYCAEGVECYVETREGGLIKAGKKMSLLRVLSSGKVELVDGLLRINVVPKDQVATWIEKFKKGRAG